MADLIEIHDVGNVLNDTVIHEHLNLTIQKGSIVAIIGSSGAGKTTLLQNLLMLLKPTQGSIKLFGEDILNCTDSIAQSVRQRFGVMFQQCALFSNLTVLENILFPIKQFSQLEKEFATHLALLKIQLVGLPETAAHKYPSELSGGMLKRAAAARAIALDPELLLLDEPTSGLDPKSTIDFNRLIAKLRDMLELTIVMITHDVHSLSHLADQVVFLGDKHVLACGTLKQVKQNPHPLIQSYFGDS